MSVNLAKLNVFYWRPSDHYVAGILLTVKTPYKLAFAFSGGIDALQPVDSRFIFFDPLNRNCFDWSDDSLQSSPFVVNF